MNCFRFLHRFQTECSSIFAIFERCLAVFGRSRCLEDGFGTHILEIVKVTSGCHVCALGLFFSLESVRTRPVRDVPGSLPGVLEAQRLSCIMKFSFPKTRMAPASPLETQVLPRMQNNARFSFPKGKQAMKLQIPRTPVNRIGVPKYLGSIGPA